MCQTQHHDKDRIADEIKATVGNLVLWRAALDAIATEPLPAPVLSYLQRAKLHYTQAIDRANTAHEALTEREAREHAAALAAAIAI